MTNTKQYGMLCHRALEIAKKYHEGQVDKAGNDYIFHLKTVASTFMAQDECVVSLLHDILEDTPCRVTDLISYGIPKHLIASIEALTRKEGESYFDYVRRLMNDPLALKVKIADLRHNLDASRFPDPDTYPPSLKRRYEKALEMLLEQERIIFGNE